jgi:hypothetical protein
MMLVACGHSTARALRQISQSGTRAGQTRIFRRVVAASLPNSMANCMLPRARTAVHDAAATETEEEQMRLAMAVMTATMVATAMMATVPRASAQTCQQLWEERNGYYKEHGYCFKTERAIKFFGNGGCRHNEESAVPLSNRERSRIAEITRIEKERGCE